MVAYKDIEKTNDDQIKMVKKQSPSPQPQLTNKHKAEIAKAYRERKKLKTKEFEERMKRMETENTVLAEEIKELEAHKNRLAYMHCYFQYLKFFGNLNTISKLNDLVVFSQFLNKNGAFDKKMITENQTCETNQFEEANQTQTQLTYSFPSIRC